MKVKNYHHPRVLPSNEKVGNEVLEIRPPFGGQVDIAPITHPLGPPLSKKRGKILGNSSCLLPCHRGELKWGLNFGKYFEIHSINSRRSNGIQEKSKIFQILSFSPREKTKLVCSNSSKDWGSKNMLIFSWPNNQERLSKKT